MPRIEITPTQDAIYPYRVTENGKTVDDFGCYLSARYYADELRAYLKRK